MKGEEVDECNGFKRFNRFTGLAPGAAPSTDYE